MPVIKQLGIQPGLTPEYIRRERDLIKQINDALAGQEATIAALRAEPVCFAFAAGTTDGAGGITQHYAFGGQLEVQGTSIALRFTDARPNSEYTFGALLLRASGPPHFIVTSELVRQTTEFCAVVYRSEAGGTIPANSNIIGTTLWAIGPRA